jgi:ABC-type uncharacterized transport system substrate-binding protein
MRAISSQWSVVSKGVFCITLCALLFALCSFVDAQQPAKIRRIGFLSALSPPPVTSGSNVEAFRQGLETLGWIEGQNIAIEYRWAQGKYDRLPELAAELVRLKVEVIVTNASERVKGQVFIFDLEFALSKTK